MCKVFFWSIGVSDMDQKRYFVNLRSLCYAMCVTAVKQSVFHNALHCSTYRVSMLYEQYSDVSLYTPYSTLLYTPYRQNDTMRSVV